MQFLYNQPLAHRFGVGLQTCLQEEVWTRFDAAVAWVRRTGTRHLTPYIQNMLGRGGIVRLIVGVDIENTSREGLQALLNLESFGDVQTHVYHNESRGTFHPKVYLFTNETDARLIVGSNNLTEAGLFTNTEAGLQVEGRITDSVIVATQSAMRSWADTNQGLAKRLTAELLGELVEEGYVHSEASLHRRRRESEASRRRTPTGTVRRQLFGSRPIPAAPAVAEPETENEVAAEPTGGGPAPEAPTTAQETLVGTIPVRGYQPLVMTNVILMKILTARGTQSQLPLPVWRSPFFAGITHIISDHDNSEHHLGPTHPERGAGAENTCKMEIQESEGMTTPVLRIERRNGEVHYQCYDAATSEEGAEILRSLEGGRIQNPPVTVLTRRRTPALSTWYRFV